MTQWETGQGAWDKAIGFHRLFSVLVLIDVDRLAVLDYAEIPCKNRILVQLNFNSV